MNQGRSSVHHRTSAAALFLVALAWRAWWGRSTPPGMNHDAADNVLAAADPQGLGLLFTQTHGMAKEPLFHLLLRPLLELLPPEQALTGLSILLGSLAAPAAWLMLGAAGLRAGRLPATLWVTLGAWPVLYSLVGFRVICGLPLAFLGLAGVLEVQSRRTDGRAAPAWLLVGTGLVLSIGLYAYTTGKLVALLAVGWLAIGLLRQRGPDVPRVLGLGILGLLPALPWILALLGAEGQEVLARGGYVFRAGGPEAGALLRDCLLLPLHLGEAYGTLSRADFISDGAAVVLPLTGARPLATPLALLLLIGLLPGAPARGRGLALLLYVGHVAVLGSAGPSPTRFLLATPALALLVGGGAEALLEGLRERLPSSSISQALPAVVSAIVVLAAAGNTARALGPHDRAWVYFPAAVTQATQVGLDLPADRTPVVVVPHSRSVVAVGALGRPDLRPVEFYRAPGTLADTDLPADLDRPLFVIVVHDRTQVFAGSLMERWPTGTFHQVHGPSDRLHGGVVVFDPEGG